MGKNLNLTKLRYGTKDRSSKKRKYDDLFEDMGIDKL